ncbi:MAG: rRNA maturation RNase YbeY [Clostridia bacterium]|nr:rRNA maturation RNase YbeY [Clostridia bacterium]
MIVNFLNKTEVPKATRDEMVKVMEKALQVLKQTALLEINVGFVSADEIRAVNLEQRDKDTPTDVLSFPASDVKVGEVIDVTKDEYKYNINPENEAFSLGDMIICLEVAKTQAKAFGHSLKDELVRLSLHSLLHCLGYDHIEDKDYEIMHKLELGVAKLCCYNFEE